MNGEIGLALRNVKTRPVQTIVAIVVVALATALLVAVLHLNQGLQRGIVRASDPFGVLVVGAKGSSQQLVLSTLMLQGLPVGNIPGAIYAGLANDERVSYAVPMAMGDNIGGARVIGVTDDFFRLRPDETSPPTFVLAEGRNFENDFEVVLGSKAARSLGLGIGDAFHVAHGVEVGLEDDSHEEEFVITGILASTDTPFDAAALTTVHSVVSVHEHEEEDEGHQEGEDDHQDDATHSLVEEIAEGDVTAILVKPASFSAANQLWREFYVGTEAQAVFPGAELGALFDLLNQGQRVLQIVAYLAAAMAGLTLFLAIYSAIEAREHLLAILRALGASRRMVLRIVLFEGVIVALSGVFLGRVLGYATASIVLGALSERSSIPLRVNYMPEMEVWLWLAPLAIGLVAASIPAYQAYRANVVAKLFPS